MIYLRCEQAIYNGGGIFLDKDKSKKVGSQKDREEYGYGYDRSVDDLKVVGENKEKKKDTNERK